MHNLIYWDIYETRTKSSPINGVLLRGRLRKLCLNKKRNILVENTQDISESVRFAIPTSEDSSDIKKYLETIFSDVSIELVMKNTPNPVLSKLKVNLEDRYTL